MDRCIGSQSSVGCIHELVGTAKGKRSGSVGRDDFGDVICDRSFC